MKALLMKLFKRRAEPAQAPAPALTPAVPQKPAAKRRYGKRKPRHPTPKGAVRGDINGSLIEQARQAGGIKQ
ncbi:hypothetical protein [Burkholderia territorii]|uniref:hypothetical protein n=1 Tax=Burkholderia territorii TaxID=1503055 RepID=UPI00075859BB|nr:hypothetical protein [Burkholderia territorii]KVQ70028.1 hypothetical protein WT23_04975 [Burkholderia territorii]